MTETSGDETTRTAAGNPVARLGLRLGWASLLPFVILALWLFSIAADHPWRQGTIQMLVLYGAVFLTFIGGARFGMASGAKQARPVDMALSVLPMVAALASFALQPPYTFAALAVVFAAAGAWDAIASHSGSAPAWYGKARVRQTVVIVATMVLAFAATAS